jgi:hypothetical protein
MGITPCGVHDQASLVSANRLCESFGTILKDDVPPSLSARYGGVDLLAVVVVDGRNGDNALELGLADLALDLAAVDSKVTEICEKLLSTVLGADQVEESGGVVDEGCPTLAVDEGGMCEELDQEGNVGLDTTDTELD